MNQRFFLCFVAVFTFAFIFLFSIRAEAMLKVPEPKMEKSDEVQSENEFTLHKEEDGKLELFTPDKPFKIVGKTTAYGKVSVVLKNAEGVNVLSGNFDQRPGRSVKTFPADGQYSIDLSHQDRSLRVEAKVLVYDATKCAPDEYTDAHFPKRDLKL